MSVTGKFQLEKNENFYEHLVALGIPEEKATIVDRVMPILEISINGKNISFVSHSGEYRHKSDLVFDEEVNETIAVDINIRSIAKKVAENKIEVYSKGLTGEPGFRRFEFSEDGMIMTIENQSKSVPVAKRFYKRLE